MIEGERLREALWRWPWSSARQPIEEVASRRREVVFAVGGFLRDLLLEHQPSDLDLVVEGDGVGYAEDLAAVLGVPVRGNRRFLTAALRLPGCGRIDVSTARSESYGAPGALPEVTPATLAEDLKRRDFTINTFSVALAGEASHELRSVAGAIEDLAERRIRVLHPASFLDDPTRLLRAVDLEIRLGGRMGEETEVLARAALAAGVLSSVSGERLWAEMERSLDEPTAVVAALTRWSGLDAYALLFAGFGPLAEKESLVDSCLRLVRRLHGNEVGLERLSVATTLLALAWREPVSRVKAFVDRYHPPQQIRRELLRLDGQLVESLAVLGAESSAPSALHAALGDLTTPELALVGALVGQAGEERVLREADAGRRPELHIRGRDLVARGAVPGPAIGEALAKTRAARLDGLIDGDSELDYALEVLGALEVLEAWEALGNPPNAKPRIDS